MMLKTFPGHVEQHLVSPNSPFFSISILFPNPHRFIPQTAFQEPISFYSEALTIKLTPRSVRSTKTVENHKTKKIPPLKPSEMDEGLFDEEFGGKDDFNEIKTLRESER